MKKDLIIQYSLLIFSLACFSFHADARDVYVTAASSGASSGDGTPTNPVSLSRLSTILSSHTVSTDGTELNVYFEGGDYNIPSGGFTFNTRANVMDLEVLFIPMDDSQSEVIFVGNGSNTKLLSTPNMDYSATRDNPMSVIIRDITIRDFVSTSTGSSSGGTSLFSVGNYTTLELDNVTISHIRSRQLPLFYIAGDATAKVSNSKISDVAVCTTSLTGIGSNPIFTATGTANANSTLEFSGCEFSEWATTGYIFNINNSSTLALDDITVDEFNLSDYFIYGSSSGADISVNNLTFTNSTFSDYIFYPTNVSSFSLTDFEFSDNTNSTSLLYSSNSSNNIVVSNVKIKNNQIVSANPFFNLTNAASATFENLEVEGNKFSNPVVTAGNTNVNLTLSNSKFVDNEISSGTTTLTGVLINGSAHGSINIEQSIFDNNRGTGNNIHLINCASTNDFVLHNSTFSNNSLNGSGSLLYFQGTTAAAGNAERLIYNNTFSGNQALTYSINILRALTGGIFNNTFYDNGGGIQVGNYAYPIKNNLLIESGSISGVAWTNVARNIWNGIFYEFGQTTSEPIPNISDYIYDLQEYASGRSKIHPLKFVESYNPFIEKGGTIELLGDYADLLIYDQRGIKRPEEISLGSWDLPNFGAVRGSYTIHYDPEVGFNNPYLLDFSDYITAYPEGATKDNIQYEIIQQPNNGTITNNGKNASFIPKMQENGNPAHGIVGVPYEMVYKVSYSYGGILFERNNTIKITIININIPMGIIDETILECFRIMGEVDFKAKYKFISGSYNNNSVTGVTYADGTKDIVTTFPNARNLKYNGFSIPLVGDLDGDGKPEIVALGTPNNSALAQVASAICILNGQTGKEIVRYALPGTWTLNSTGYHGSPSSMVLVDADRNGRAEIIIATGSLSGSNSAYSGRLLCYEVNENTFIDREGGSDSGNPNKLTLKWVSKTSFSTSIKALPQVVDFDGDGIPEILVCNKIYSALDGEELLELDENFIGRDPGANGGGTNGDRLIPFPYIYDVDMDGKYDIAAGGKLYYNIDFKSKTFDTKEMPEIGADGHTAVADINGDGIPDIIVSSGVGPHKIWVWNPGFFERDGNIIEEGTGNPSLMAYQESQVGLTNTGTHSYIYVGDIDGRIDESGKKLPEISIIGGRYFTSRPVPIHPNVKNINNGVPFTLNANGTLSYSLNEYIFISFTWDEEATEINEKLKVSFILKHKDTSVNTGFTLFDFNNDGIQQICYRDEEYLRIISAAKRPYYSSSDTDVDMRVPVRSWTGFEYPVVADIDGDGSADMIVMGHNQSGDHSYSYIYAVESVTGDFAPAPMVWNQFMYDPLKINEDLTTPLVAIHPLSDQLAFIKEHDEGYGPQHIYNKTISQAVISAVFEDEDGEVLRPIVATPDAAVDGEMFIDVDDSDNKQIHIYISNHGDATLNARTPLRIYKDEVGEANLITTLGGESVPEVIGSDVFPGDTLHIILKNLSDAEYARNYIVRVTDNSGTNSSGQWEDTFGIDEHYHDCNWADNWNIIGVFVLRDDAYTIAQYNTELLDILANDHFPDNFNPVLTEDMIVPVDTDPDKDIGSWEIVNNKLKYTAPATYDKDVIEFKFTMTHEDQGTSITHTSTIYIFLLQSASDDGFTVCLGEEYYVRLKVSDENHEFDWYNESQVYLATAPYIQYVSQDYLFYAKPTFNNPDHPSTYKNIMFPMGKVYVNAIIPSEGETLTAKWKGTVDSDWHNPANWVEVRNGVEMPVQWIPTHCVDIILEEEAPYYPDLRAKGVVNNIFMKNRSMIGKVHQLTYKKVDLELKLKPTERNRFVMWSAPLKNMYTGDYHFKKDGKPNWGDVYMNYFQSGNPDFPTSVAIDNAFTATFGTVNDTLTINKPFAIKVVNLDTETTFTFPKTDTSYTPEGSTTPLPIARDGTGSKFIVDGLMDENGDFDMPVNDEEDRRMIHVSNPFMAYLDAEAFLQANSGLIENSYKLWSKENDHFITYTEATGDDQFNHFIVDDYENLEDSEGLIAPLQSFFVLKSDKDIKIPSLKISASMTTTIHPDEANYELRSSTKKEWYVMRISAKQDDYENMTVLHYSPQAVQAYLPEEDSRKLFDPESPLSVYTLSPSLDALAVYSSGDFSQDVKLGLRLKKAGKVTFNFTGMYLFQHEVYLIDHEDDDKVYDLSVTPELTFDIEDYSTGNYIELNNRFSLNFNYAPTGTAVVKEDGITVSSRNGFLFIEANGREINKLQVYNLWGQLVSAPGKKDIQYKVPVQPNQFYLVKGELNGKIHITKVIAR